MLAVFDIGGSRVRVARALAPCRVEVLAEWPTERDSFAEFVSTLKRGVTRVGETKHGVAVSIAGAVAPETGLIKVANIPCLDGRALAQDLSQALGCRVVIANDADCFALAEAKDGAGVGQRVVFGVILGTGIGGGLVIDGRIHAGAGGVSGEWGHGPVLRNRIEGEAREIPHWPCGCGLEGCVDTLGARGLERLDGYLNGTCRTSVEILQHWQSGEPEALRSVRAWLDLVSAPLAMVVNVIGPSVVPVGGGLGGNTQLVTALDRQVRARILRKTEGPLLQPARHQVEPGLIGASWLGFEEIARG